MVGFWFVDKAQRNGHHAQAKQNEVVQINQQVSCLLAPVLINQVVEFNDIGKEEPYHNEKDKNWRPGERFSGKVIRNSDDGFPKHHDYQGRQPFQNVGKDNRVVAGIFTSKRRRNPANHDSSQGNRNPPGVIEEDTNQQGDRPEAEDSRKRHRNLLIYLFFGPEVGNQVLQAQR